MLHAFTLPLLAGVCGAGLTSSTDGDLWWHLAAAREILRSGHLLYSDPFSISAAGRPWYDVHWLFQLASFALYRCGGLAALIAVKCGLLALGAWLLLRTVRQRGGVGAVAWFAPLLLLASFLVRDLLLVRPVIGTLVCLSCALHQLEHFRRDGRRVWLLALPLLQLVWVNFQGLFALGPAVVGAYALAFGASEHFGTRAWFPFAQEQRPALARASQRDLWLCGVATALACCVTPYGLPALLLPLRLLGRLSPEHANVFSENVAENVPPLLLDRAGSDQFFHFKWFLLLLAVSLIVSRRRLLLSHALLLLGFVGLALTANRNVLLLYWMATPLIALNLHAATSALMRSARLQRWALRTSFVSGLAVCGLIGVAVAREPSLAEPAPFRVPARSAEWIAQHGKPGRVFAADHYGGYLIWRLFPAQRPYIDTRLILRTPEEYAEYLALADDPTRFRAFQREYGFDYVVLPTAYPDRYLGLIAELYRDSAWKLVATDGNEVLFARAQACGEPSLDLSDPASVDRLLQDSDRQFAGEPRLQEASRVHLATLELALGLPVAADRALATLHGSDAEALRARSLLARDDFQGARRLGEALVRANDRDVASLTLTAVASIGAGDVAAAKTLLQRALSIEPFDAEARSVLRNLEEAQHVSRHP